jgi:oligopeptide/dipeptide ABC transporter ATP-binding protein
VVEHISHRVAVMYLGRIVETDRQDEPVRDAAAPLHRGVARRGADPKARAKGRSRVILTGDVPSPINPPSGCHFHTRCAYAMARCEARRRFLREAAPGHWAACHLHDGGLRFPLEKPAGA